MTAYTFDKNMITYNDSYLCYSNTHQNHIQAQTTFGGELYAPADAAMQPDWKSNLPTPTQLLLSPFGQPYEDHSFPQVSSFETTVS